MDRSDRHLQYPWGECALAMGEEGQWKIRACIFVCLCVQPRMTSEVVYISIDEVRLRLASQIEKVAATRMVLALHR